MSSMQTLSVQIIIMTIMLVIRAPYSNTTTTTISGAKNSGI
jgi:hypothetical protein